jgi:hypothetical protein
MDKKEDELEYFETLIRRGIITHPRQRFSLSESMEIFLPPDIKPHQRDSGVQDEYRAFAKEA